MIAEAIQGDLNKPMLTVLEASNILRISTRSVQRMLASTSIRRHKVGGRTLIARGDIIRLINGKDGIRL